MCSVCLHSQASMCLGHSVQGNAGPLTPSLGKHLLVCCLLKATDSLGVHREESRWPWTQRCLVRGRCEDLESAWSRGAPSSCGGCHHMVSESSGCHKEERLTLVFVASRERTKGTEGHSTLLFEEGRALPAVIRWREPGSFKLLLDN